MNKKIYNPKKLVKNTFVADSLPDPTKLVNTLESLPDPLEVVNTVVAESLPTELVNRFDTLPTEVVNTVVEESLPAEVVNTVVSENLPIELVNRFIEDTLPDPLKLANRFIEDTLPTELNMVETSENTLNVLLETSNIESKVTLPSPFDAIYNKKRLPVKIQLSNETEKEKDKDTEKNQDTIQKLAVVSTLVLELYRMLTSSLLILFVPQSCGGSLCSISDNLTWNPDHHQYNFGICVNFITLFIFSCLYAVELKRENRLIKYLHVNPEMPSSNDAVEKTLEHIDIEKKRKILSIDKQYQVISYLSIGMYAFNSIVSGVIISHYYFGSQTTTSFITSLLFMFTKLINVYQVSNTEENIFYSGYMKTFVQFNDLDETHKIPDNL
jgi:hypothetical protein